MFIYLVVKDCTIRMFMNLILVNLSIGTDNYISPGFLNIQSTYTKLAVLLTVYSRLTDIPQPVGFSI